VGEIGAAAVSVRSPRGEFLEIVAGRERRAIGRDDDGAQRAIVSDGAQLRCECLQQRLRQAVARLRPIESQDCDRACAVAQQRYINGWGRGGERHGIHRKMKRVGNSAP
jgi:hypothetical protein